MPRYHISSAGNGAVVSIERIEDGASLLIQGEDAAEFLGRLEMLSHAGQQDDLCDEYADLLRPGRIQ